MFSRIPCILNLIGFVAHAVFGCCGHHQHGNSIGCCGNTLQSRLSEDSDNCCTSDSGHHHDTQPICEIGDDCGNEVTEVPGDQDDEQGCNEGRCTYVGASTGIDMLTELGVGIAEDWIADSIDIGSTIPCRAGSICERLTVLWTTPPTLCAALQSWQI